MSFRPWVAGIFLLLSGCDPFYGVESRTTLSGPVDVSCINSALTSVPEALTPRYERHVQQAWELAPPWHKVITVLHFWYYGENGSARLEVDHSPYGWEFSNTRENMGRPVSREEMDRFIPLMEKVNAVIQDQCGLPVANLRPKPVGETKPQDL